MSYLRWIGSLRAIAPLLALMLLSGCDEWGREEAESGAETSAGTQDTASTASSVESEAPSALDILPFDHRATGLLIDDLDRNGLDDIILISHAGNTAVPFRQTAPRQFEAGPSIDFMGFHPNDIVRLPFGTGNTFLINAEGESKLRFFTFDAELNSTLSGQLTTAFPRFTTAFSWPGWAESLAVTPYSGGHLTLFKGFDAESYTFEEQFQIDLSPSSRLMPWLPVVTDLDGDAVEELVFAVPKQRTVKALRWSGEDALPTMETLWTAPDRGTPHYVVPALLDADERVDLIVVGNTLKAVYVLINEGDGGFRAIPFDLGDAIATDAAFATSKDGKRYLFVGSTSRFFLFEFPPDSAEPSNVWTADNVLQGMVRVGLKDLDGDGYLDAVFVRNGTFYSNVVIYGPLAENFEELSNELALTPKNLPQDIVPQNLTREEKAENAQ